MSRVLAFCFFLGWASWAQTNGDFNVPVVYGRPVNDAVLSPDLIQKLVRDALNLVKEQKPWFVYTEQSQASMSARVYFEPTSHVGRLQKGSFLLCSVVNENVDVSCNNPRNYGYVAPKMEIFHGLFPTPTVANVPFEVDAKLSDEDVVSVVDFLRSADARGQTQTMKQKLMNDFCVLSVKAAVGNVDVRLGAPGRSVLGLQQTVRLRKEGAAWKIVFIAVLMA